MESMSETSSNLNLEHKIGKVLGLVPNQFLAHLYSIRASTCCTLLLFILTISLIAIDSVQPAEAGQAGQSIFSTKGHPKSRGVNLTLSYPEDWLSFPGERPHMVNSFAIRKPWGAATAILGIRKADVPRRGYFTDSEAEVYLTSKKFFNSYFGSPPICRVIDSRLSTIESLPALLVECEGHQGRLDQKWAFRAWILVFIVGAAIVGLDCRVMVQPGNEEQLPHRMEEIGPHFLNMANSIVINNLWVE